MKILVTGAAGFIGFHLSKLFLARGDAVVGIDNINDYYDINLKLARLEQLKPFNNFHFEKLDLADRPGMEQLFQRHQFDRVVNLAAQAGVRYSIDNPHTYIDANIVGFMNILEGCRNTAVAHLSYASSSSVYGANTHQPFSEQHNVDHPVSLYAASKKANELMAHTYSSLYNLPTTGLRFFTVYGPWGRPDMALFKFTKGIFDNSPIDIYNQGKMQRDFTYIDDIVQSVMLVTDQIPESNSHWSGDTPDPSSSYAPYRLFNIGNNAPVALLDFVDAIERATGKKADRRYLPMQDGDVVSTYANCDALEKAINFKPSTHLDEGIQQFVRWYREYYKI